VRGSHGTFTVAAGDAGFSTVTLDTHFEPLDQKAAADVSKMFDGAFQYSLEGSAALSSKGPAGNAT